MDGREWNVRLSRSSTDVCSTRSPPPSTHSGSRATTSPTTPTGSPRPSRRRAGRDQESPCQASSCALALPGRDPRRAHGRARGPRLHAQPRRRADRYRQDRGRRARLPTAPSGARRPAPAVRRAPRADPAPVAAHLPGGARRRRFGELLVGGHRPTDGRHVFASIQTLSSPEARALIGTTSTWSSSTSSTTPRRPPTAAARPGCRPLAAGADRDTRARRRARHPPLDRRARRLRHAAVARAGPPAARPFQYFGSPTSSTTRRCAGRPGSTTSRTSATSYRQRRPRPARRQARSSASSPTRGCGRSGSAPPSSTPTPWRRCSPAWAGRRRDRRHHAAAGAERHIDALRSGELTTIFSRDVFNEGVDIPEADTILLLRPTESVTVHLQQLGRGLRRHPDKDVCTVLDFVGQHRREYRFDLRLRAMTGISAPAAREAAEEGFPYLPSGCHLELDRQAREWVSSTSRRRSRPTSGPSRAELTLLGQPARTARSATAGHLPRRDRCRARGRRQGRGMGDAAARATSSRARPGRQRPRCRRACVGCCTSTTSTASRRSQTWLRRSVPAVTGERDRRLAWMFLVTLWGLKNAARRPGEPRGAGLFDAPAVVDELRRDAAAAA
jgi:hypothetical protein